MSRVLSLGCLSALLSVILLASSPTMTVAVPPPIPLAAEPCTTEPDTNRGGQDYTNFDTPSSDACRVACENDAQCKSYTYVKPGLQGPSAKCWLKTGVPPAASDTCCVSGVKQAAPPPGPGGADQGEEPFINRPGQDYKNFNLPAADPALCKAACDGETQCQAYTYVKPGVQGPSAKCWLKTGVPLAKSDTCCSSGVKQAAPPPPPPPTLSGPGGADQGEEPFTNRPGQDYKHFNLAAADPGLCKCACDGDPQCQAYTYVKPGVQGSSAVCWLKTGVPPAKADDCCSSGIKSAAGADKGEEPFTNRPGQDYRVYDLDASICKAICDGDPQCLAYTYIKPGVQGPNARCWLKNGVPAPEPDTCCSSGVK